MVVNTVSMASMSESNINAEDSITDDSSISKYIKVGNHFTGRRNREIVLLSPAYLCAAGFMGTKPYEIPKDHENILQWNSVNSKFRNFEN